MSSRNNPASEDVRADPLAFVGLHSSVEARSQFPQHTWALALHRGTMNQAKAPISLTLPQCSAHLRFRSRSRWAGMRGSSGKTGVPFPDARERRLPRIVFADGWKAQGLDDHAQGAWVEQTQDLLQAQRAMVVRRKMDNEHTLSSAPIRSSAVSCSKPRFLTRMEEISLFHQRGCRKNRHMALLSDMLALG